MPPPAWWDDIHICREKESRNPHGGLRRSSKSEPTRALSCLFSFLSTVQQHVSCNILTIHSRRFKINYVFIYHWLRLFSGRSSLCVTVSLIRLSSMACTVSIKIKLFSFLCACTTVFIVGCTSLIDKNYMMKSLEICTNWGWFEENRPTTVAFATSCLADILTRSRSAPKSLHVIQSDGKLSHFHVQRKSHQKMALVGECTSYKLPKVKVVVLSISESHTHEHWSGVASTRAKASCTAWGEKKETTQPMLTKE